MHSALPAPEASVSLSASLNGTATDPTGALLPDAQITLASRATQQHLTADSTGHFSAQVPPGTYELTVTAEGFTPFHRRLQLRAGQTLTLTTPMAMVTHAEDLDVSADSRTGSSDPADNQDALIFHADKLATLSNDDSTLQRQLIGLAGGGEPGSTQFFIDGFSGGRFPPKDTIREVRINQNPFSAQYDRRGFGRIEIFTKPGTNNLHGSARVGGNDNAFNAPNPYAGFQLPYHSELLQTDINGPLGKHSSFFLATNLQNDQGNVPVNAIVLDSNLQPTAPLSQAVPNPQNSQNYSLRLDRQFGKNDTLTGRYEYNRFTQTNAGVGQLTLASQGFNTETGTQTLQLGNTMLFGTKIVNETRFQYLRTRLNQIAASTAPTLIVQGFFNGGGSPAQNLRDNQDAYEMQEYLSIDRGHHFLRAGVRARIYRDANASTANYNGQYIFPNLTVYQITLQGLQQGLSAAQIRANGGGATQFNITAGTPAATVLVGDVGAYFEDEWKARPNLTLTAGLRFESQTGIPDNTDPAPRFGFNWALGSRKGAPALLILRGGSGFYYDRFAAGNILQTLRQNGVTQRPYYVEKPDFYPELPDPASLPSITPTVYRIDPRFRSSVLNFSSISVEHSWAKRGTAAVSFYNVHAYHMPLSLNINAPLPGTYNVAVPGSGVRPSGGTQNIYQYTSEGINNAQTLSANTNLNFGKRLEVWAFYQAQWRSTDASGANNFPSNQYDLHADTGRSAFLTRNRLYMGVNGDLPWGFNTALFLSTHSGPPFNITIGQDINGDTQFNDRPSFATDLTRASVVRTAFGNFDTQPIAGQQIIPINYGHSPAFVSLQTTLGKTVHVGPRMAPTETAKGGAAGQASQASQGERRYELNFSVEASNVLNTNNPAQPIGVLASPTLFGRSISLNNEEAESTAANRVVKLYAGFRF